MSPARRIVLAAHGCGDDSDQNALVRALAQELRVVLETDVVAAFNLGTPAFEDAIAPAATTIVVPIMMADGYFTNQVLRPRAAAAARAIGARTLQLPPLGTWSELREAFVASATAFIGALETPAHVIVAGHGTRRNPDSGTTTISLASTLAEKLDRSVGVGFIDQEPQLDDALSAAGGHNVCIVPWMLGGGGHALEDVPAAAAAYTAQTGGHVDVAPTVAQLPILAQLIERRVRDAGPLRLATRCSTLAKIQSAQVADVLAGVGIDVVDVDVVTDADAQLTIPIEELTGVSPFADELMATVQRGDADIATHSRKDVEANPDLPLLAYLPRHDAGESLVARDGRTLDDLPSGALVGVSSPRRASQLLKLRGDLRVAPIRGPVDARIEQVNAGVFDATLLAVAGIERLGLGHTITQRFSHEQIMPDPGQGAIVIQGRQAIWARHVDHLPTRHAVEAEFAFAEAVATNDAPLLTAAFAVTDERGMIELHARIIDPDTHEQFDGHVTGHDPALLGIALARDLLESAGLPEGATP
ncbi:MAG: hydroxymethylbilane synthase [Planctomycetota bacterium]